MTFLTILTHTPLYVWAILVYLAWQGVQSLHRRSQSIWRLMAVPLVFAASGLALLWRADGLAHGLPWLGAAALSAVLGAQTAPRVIAVDPIRRVVTRAGSSVPLVRNVVVFGAQYALGVASALHPEERDAIALAAALLSGATIGYVAGWIWTTLRAFQAAPRSPINPSSPAPNRS